MNAVKHGLRTADPRAHYTFGLQSAGARSRAFSGDRVRSTWRKALDGAEALPRLGQVPGPERGRAQRRLSSCPGTLPVGETRGCGGKAPATSLNRTTTARAYPSSKSCCSRIALLPGRGSFRESPNNEVICLFVCQRSWIACAPVNVAKRNNSQKIFCCFQNFMRIIDIFLRIYFRVFIFNFDLSQQTNHTFNPVYCRRIIHNDNRVNFVQKFIVKCFIIYIYFCSFYQFIPTRKHIGYFSYVTKKYSARSFFVLICGNIFTDSLLYLCFRRVDFFISSSEKNNKKTCCRTKKCQTARNKCLKFLNASWAKCVDDSPSAHSEHNTPESQWEEDFSKLSAHPLFPISLEARLNCPGRCLRALP